MTWADLRRRVKDAGGVFVRSGKGAREVWRLPSGKIVTLQAKHLKQQVSKSVRDRVLQAVASA